MPSAPAVACLDAGWGWRMRLDAGIPRDIPEIPVFVSDVCC
jgi:hypothetical protein